MVIKKYKLRASVTLDAVWHRDPPEIVLALNDIPVYQGPLTSKHTFDIEKSLPKGPAWITVDLFDKKPEDTDPETGKDKAIIVDSIVFNDIPNPKYVWAGLYRPQYHEEWYQQQIANGTTPGSVLRYHNYLGWNGEWRLDFSIPIFTWIHNLEDLGWIYQ